MNITVKYIVFTWLKSNGYDGLCCEDCGCSQDDLAPCGEMDQDCVAAYRWKNGLFYEIKEPAEAEGEPNPCPSCNSHNIKCRGAITNCEDCGETWRTTKTKGMSGHNG
jgi:hypothetical protein